MSDTDRDTDEPRFEEHLAQVENAIRRLESGDIPLEDSIDLYSQAMGHLKACHTVLDAAERRLEIVRRGAAGEPEPAPADLVDGEGLQES